MTTSRRPTHPGAILRLDVIPALRTTVSGLAEMLRVPYWDLWIRMQGIRDLWDAEKNMGRELEALTPVVTPDVGDVS